MRKALIASWALSMTGVAIAAPAWVATDPSVINGQATDFFASDLRSGWKEAVPSSIYWVRLQRAADGALDVVEVSPRPIIRSSNQDEVLVVDIVKRRAHPAYEAKKQDYDARRRAACENADIAEPRPYSVCNSAFGEPPSGAARLIVGILSGGKVKPTWRRSKGSCAFSSNPRWQKS